LSVWPEPVTMLHDRLEALERRREIAQASRRFDEVALLHQQLVDVTRRLEAAKVEALGWR
jgi:hypothetical protein